MELNNAENQDALLQSIIAQLVDQNSQLRLELAAARAQLAELGKELDVLEQMKSSQAIPPEALELISKLDIR